MSDIKVNASEWNQLSEKHRTEITAIMKEHGFLGGTQKIVADESAPKAAETVRAAVSHLQASAKAQKTMAARPEAATAPQGFCKIGCDIAEAAAVAACSLVPSPGNVVCIAVAHAGGEFCRSKC
jgi:hypothetical protein